jgi:hypothetical protein
MRGGGEKKRGNDERNIDEKGEFVTLFNDLVQDEVKFKTYFRMSQEKFFDLLRILRERLQRKCTHFRKPISEIERLVITLR